MFSTFSASPEPPMPQAQTMSAVVSLHLSIWLVFFHMHLPRPRSCHTHHIIHLPKTLGHNPLYYRDCSVFSPVLAYPASSICIRLQNSTLSVQQCYRKDVLTCLHPMHFILVQLNNIRGVGVKRSALNTATTESGISWNTHGSWQCFSTYRNSPNHS